MLDRLSDNDLVCPLELLRVLTTSFLASSPFLLQPTMSIVPVFFRHFSLIASVKTHLFRSLSIGLLLAGCTICSTNLTTQVVLAGAIEFNRDIRPILSDQCFACHGPDSASRKGDLRLDQRDAAIASSALVAGKSDESEMFRRMMSEDPDVVMPPPSSHKNLTAEQRKLIQNWIDAGAEYQPHWSFIPPKTPPLPGVRDAQWPKSPMDRFVLAKLESVGLAPAPEADIRVLVRRVCLDLAGLPPTPEEIEEVVADASPDRYERYVDRLLDRPSWGEHRGRYWLDYARYADTHGIHFDNFREMYSFRDWVIAAFNANMPFDQFTIEQLAGDLLPTATLEQQIASGFNRCNITTNEGGIIDEEYAVLYARDRVETTSVVWMGLTTGCAVCHDHKFDPISQREFYQLAAYFNNTTQKVRDGNVRDTPPIVHVPMQQDRLHYVELSQSISKLNGDKDKQRRESRKIFDAWITQFDNVHSALSKQMAKLPNASSHIPLVDDDASAISVVIENQLRRYPLNKAAIHQAGHIADHAWTIQKEPRPSFSELGEFERDQSFTIAFWVKPSDAKQTGSLTTRMEDGAAARGWDIALVANKVMVQFVHKLPNDLIKITTDMTLAADKWQHLAVVYDGSSQANGVSIFFDGKKTGTKVNVDALTDTIKTTAAFRLGHRTAKSVVAEKTGIQDVRFFDSKLTEEQLRFLSSNSRATYLASKFVDKRSKAETDELFDWNLNSLDKDYQQLEAEYSQLDKERMEIEARGTVAHVMAETVELPKAYVLMRGEYDKRGDEVAPLPPSILPPMPEDFPKNRLGLARWLVMPEHPLTARVTVNRFWQEIFGQGLVTTAGDFGASGSPPSNLDLLDFLAVQFREDKWNVKNCFRTMVLSATYRQSAANTPEKIAKDPQNILLARGPRFRMDAEMIRDYVLKASGLLSTKIGGPSVRPYQPSGVWEAVAMPNSDTKSYLEDKGESLYRRSLYTFWKRSAPPASMDIFNAPSRETCTVRRERTNTPLQALVSLNDPQAIEAARNLAQTTLLKKDIDKKDLDTSQRAQFIANYVLGRCLSGEELDVVLTGYQGMLEYYQKESADAEALLTVGRSARNRKISSAEHAAWTMVINQLLNLDESLCK